MNNPKKHHYIPAFYLKRWATQNEKLIEWSQPWGSIVKPKRVHPNGTGYLSRLYELRGFESSLAQQIEAKFFSKVDSLAAEVLTEVEMNHSMIWTTAKRSAWSRFVVSLLMRCPEDLDLLRSLWASRFEETDQTQEAKYRESRGVSDPETFAEYIRALNPVEKEKYFFEVFLSLLDNPSVGSKFNYMHWDFINLDTDGTELFSSDRPIIRTNGLASPNGHLVLPVGPRRLFLAANNRSFISEIRRANARQLMLECNRQVVAASVKFSYSSSDSNKAFVQKHFGTVHQPRIASSLMRREQA